MGFETEHFDMISVKVICESVSSKRTLIRFNKKFRAISTNRRVIKRKIATAKRPKSVEPLLDNKTRSYTCNINSGEVNNKIFTTKLNRKTDFIDCFALDKASFNTCVSFGATDMT